MTITNDVLLRARVDCVCRDLLQHLQDTPTLREAFAVYDFSLVYLRLIENMLQVALDQRMDRAFNRPEAVIVGYDRHDLEMIAASGGLLVD